MLNLKTNVILFNFLLIHYFYQFTKVVTSKIGLIVKIHLILLRTVSCHLPWLEYSTSGTLKRMHHWAVSSLSPLPYYIHGHTEPYTLAILYQQLCHNKDEEVHHYSTENVFIQKTYLQMRQLSWEKSTILNKMRLDEVVHD